MGARHQHGRGHQKRGGEDAPNATPPRGRSLRCGAANARRRDAGVHVRRVGGSGRVTPGNSRDNGCTAAARRGAHQQRGGEHAPKAIPPRLEPGIVLRDCGCPPSASGISRAFRRRDPSYQRVRSSACLSSIWVSTPLVPYRSSAVGLELYSGNTFRTLCSL